jgi:hypothetical protein
MITGKFVVRIGRDILIFNTYEDIPASFDNLIEFNPDIPEEPHTEEEHQELDTLNDMLHALLRRETNARSD